MKNKLLITTSIVFALAGIGILGYTGYEYMTEQNETNKIQNVSKQATTDTQTKTNDTDQISSGNLMDDIDRGIYNPVTEFSVDWEYLKSVNPDVTAWVYIPGTSLSYPILQEKTVGSYYYLNHNLYGEYQEMGAVFTPAYIDEPNLNNQLLVFAHNSFGWYGDLYFTHLNDWYANKDIANNYRYAYVYYPDGKVEQYQNWIGHHTDIANPVYNLPQEKGSDAYRETLTYMTERATYTIGDTPSTDTKTLVLSTCEDLTTNSPNRFYAGFKLINTHQK